MAKKPKKSEVDMTLYSRSLCGGKKSSEVKSRITDESKFALQKRCHELGVTESDYVCQLIEVSLHGLEHVASIQRERLNKVVEMFPAGGRI